MEINTYPDNIIGIMFRILNGAIGIANIMVQNLSLTPKEIIENWLGEHGATEFWSKFLSGFLTANIPLINNLTMMDLLIGGALFAVLVIGVVKFIGDAIGL